MNIFQNKWANLAMFVFVTVACVIVAVSVLKFKPTGETGTLKASLDLKK